MSKGAWAASAVDSVAVAEDGYRGEVTLQLASDSTVYIGFGEVAVAGSGLWLDAGQRTLTVSDHRARMAIHVVCAEGSEAEGGYQTA